MKGSRTTRILLTLLLAVGGSVAGLSGQSIEGRLMDGETGEPIILAPVTLLLGTGEVVDRTFTDEGGFFVLASPDPGSFFLRAERMGFSSRVDGIFELGEGGRLMVEFRLRKAPIALDTLNIAVERRDPKLRLLGFYDRQRAGFGRFIGPEELESRAAVQATDLFRMIPRVRVNERPFGNSTITIAGSLSARGTPCYPRVLIDGFVVSRGGPEAARPDLWVSPGEITGIEVYRGSAETPLQFGGGSDSCGVILIWTGMRRQTP